MIPMNADGRWQIADRVTGPLGTFDVSSISTEGGEFSEMYGDQSPWPYETIIFDSKRLAVQHVPFNSKEECVTHHKMMIEAVKAGSEFGGGVDMSNDDRLPTTTPQQWFAMYPA